MTSSLATFTQVASTQTLAFIDTAVAPTTTTIYASCVPTEGYVGMDECLDDETTDVSHKHIGKPKKPKPKNGTYVGGSDAFGPRGNALGVKAVLVVIVLGAWMCLT